MSDLTTTTAAERIRLEPGWKAVLGDQFAGDYMVKLRAFLVSRMQAGNTVYPPPNQWFAAFDATRFDQVKVVIIGQDPYHGPGQAHGLCFSVPAGARPPPSLQNIFKEMASDVPHQQPADSVASPGAQPSGELSAWATQGVLLLNSVLTVERGQAGSHRNQGWETFTDHVVQQLTQHKQHLVFMLWGSYAQSKGANINRQQHLVLTAPHPSPFSAHKGFFGCRHFSLCNEYLTAHGQSPINWHAHTR